MCAQWFGTVPFYGNLERHRRLRRDAFVVPGICNRPFLSRDAVSDTVSCLSLSRLFDLDNKNTLASLDIDAVSQAIRQRIQRQKLVVCCCVRHVHHKQHSCFSSSHEPRARTPTTRGTYGTYDSTYGTSKCIHMCTYLTLYLTDLGRPISCLSSVCNLVVSLYLTEETATIPESWRNCARFRTMWTGPS